MANTAWTTARSVNAGTSTLVAVIDTGIQYDHEDLVTRMAPNTTWGRCETGTCKAYVSADTATFPVDDDGHDEFGGLSGDLPAELSEPIIGERPHICQQSPAMTHSVEGLDHEYVDARLDERGGGGMR